MKTPQPHFDDLPLRQQKAARTRAALLAALTDQLALHTLDQIKTTDLAQAAGVSPATFFNYFPAKGDLVTWFIQVWSLRMGALARKIEAEHGSGLAAIEGLFDATAAETEAQVQVFLEVIAHQARMPADLSVPEVGLADRLLALPDEPDVMSLPDQGLTGLLPHWLGHAVHNGELPAHTDIPTLMLGAASVFFGVPLAIGRTNPTAIRPLYRAQLQLLWRGARSTEAL